MVRMTDCSSLKGFCILTVSLKGLSSGRFIRLNTLGWTKLYVTTSFNPEPASRQRTFAVKDCSRVFIPRVDWPNGNVAGTLL